MVLFAFLLFACEADVGKDKAKAVVHEVEKAADHAKDAAGEAKEGAKKVAKKPTPAKPLVAPKGALKVNPAKSKLQAMAAKVVGKHPIVFHEFDGWVVSNNAEVSELGFTASMNKLQSDKKKLTKHLLDADFFDISNHPFATFRSTKIEANKAKGASHTITGLMNIRGTEKEISFPATITVKDGVVQAKTEFTIDRRWFHITYPGMKDNLIQDNVVMTIDFSTEES